VPELTRIQKPNAKFPIMTFTIEEDEEIDYTATPLQAEDSPTDMKIVMHSFPQDSESAGLLGDRVTLGFCGTVLSYTCCCFTLNKNTSLCCLFG
jgi:hypothetical protein